VTQPSNPPRVAILGTAIAKQAMDMAAAAGVEVVTTDGYLDTVALEQFMAAHEPDALIVRLGKVTETAIAVDPRLKIIAKHGVGYDTIDVAAAERQGVLVSIATGANAISVAEHAIALLLGVTRRIAHLDARLRAGHWDKAHFLGTELNGKRIGIVGLGAIGRHLAKLCNAFGMKVVVFDPALPDTGLDGYDRADTIEQILRDCDVVSLHCPLNAGTRDMISAPQLAIMKPSAILLNTARGGLVDLAALEAALSTNQIGGAGLDTFPVEPPELSEKLRSLPNIVISPHVGASTVEAGERVGVTAMSQVLDYIAGKEIDARFAVNGAPRRLPG